MSTVAITADALALMSELNGAAKELAGIVSDFRVDLAEFKQSIRKPVLLTVEEAAQYINVSPHTLNKYRTEGKIGGRTPMPGYLKIGDKVLYEVAELNRWIAEDLPRKGYREGGDGK